MALIFADLVQETSLSTGTGALLLLGPTNYMRAFSAAMVNTDTCWVRITEAGSANWEESLATYSGGALTRSFAAGSKSSTGSLVNFGTGLKTISLIAPRNSMVLLDANGDAAITRNLTTGGSIGVGTTSVSGYGVRVSGNPTGSSTQRGVSVDGTIQSGITTGAYGYESLPATAAASFTLPALTHFRAAQGTFGAGSTVTNQYGFRAESTLIGGTTNYGFRSDLQLDGTNRWNFYAAGTAPNYFAGAVGIGNTALTGYSLRLNKTVTGSTNSIGVSSGGAIQSDVTATVRMVMTTPSVVAASFTLTNLYHFRAEQGSIGAGATVTNQYGYSVESSLVGATNNYGFHSNLATAANRWNFYAAGTAPNFMAGFLGLGAATTPGTALDVGSDQIRVRTAKTPSSASDAGNAGTICWDSSYVYVCTATNTWKRAAISTW